jgi:hypothetical protein
MGIAICSAKAEPYRNTLRKDYRNTLRKDYRNTLTKDVNNENHRRRHFDRGNTKRSTELSPRIQTLCAPLLRAKCASVTSVVHL